MGRIDRLKALQPRVLDRLTPQRVVFHHVPKCGGTSVGRALRKRYLLSQATVTPEASFRAFEAFTGRSDREAMLVDVLDLREQMLLYLLYEDVRCVSLHVRFSAAAHARFADRYKFVTILREPVARFISHFFWSHGKPQAFGRIEEPFAEFLETERARRLGATYVEFYSGLPRQADITAPDAVAAAIANLGRFDVVGRLDDLAGFEAGLQRALGLRLRIGHENRMRQPRERADAVVTPELRARVAALCAPDIAVWEAVTGADTRATTRATTWADPGATA
jgi:hypothetical protein